MVNKIENVILSISGTSSNFSRKQDFKNMNIIISFQLGALILR